MNYLERLEFIQRLQPGIYTLACHVDNPKPDRRSRHDWRHAVRWDKGTRFTVQPYLGPDGQVLGHAITSGRFTHQTVHAPFGGRVSDAERLDALLPALVHDTAPDAEYRWAFERRGWGTRALADDVLRRLFVTKQITLAQIDEALDAELNEEDAG